MQRRFLTAATLALVATGIACGAGGVRPSYKPFPQAAVDTIKGSPSAIIQEASSRILAENMQTQWVSPAEGYLETQSYNVVTRTSGNIQNADRENYITIRIWADSIGAGMSKVTAEATVLRSSDASVIGREREAAVPPGHPGDVIVHRVLAGLRERFGH
ncbi:MAG TPA: hypothetical protein VGI83_08105 [Gemmatimonadales bacterium]|jgi:hypothetical protein